MARRLTKSASDRSVSLIALALLGLTVAGLIAVLAMSGLLLPGLLVGAIGGLLAERRRRKRIASYWKDTVELDITPRRIRRWQNAGWFAFSMVAAITMFLGIMLLVRLFFPPEPPKKPAPDPAMPAIIQIVTPAEPTITVEHDDCT